MSYIGNSDDELSISRSEESIKKEVNKRNERARKFQEEKRKEQEYRIQEQRGDQRKGRKKYYIGI